jgi:pimeloyl-[acyl-carrier protein] methyl ester esterase
VNNGEAETMSKKPANKNPNAELNAHVILIRGLAREARHWGSFTGDLEKAMASAFGSARVDAIDLPGTGVFSEMKSPLTIAEIAEFVRGKFLEIRHKQRMNGEPTAKRSFIVAVSLGGMVASYWIDRWPEDFTGAVFINTSFKKLSPFYRRLMPSFYRSMFEIFRTRDARARELEILKIISNRPELYESTAEDWTAIQLTRPVSIENCVRQLTAASLYQPPSHPPSIPVLILGCQKDRMVHPSCSEEIAEHWHAEFKQHPTAGHDLTLDDPEWAISACLLFVDDAANLK